MRIMLSAGEASGDMHGARLIAELKQLRPNASFLGMGGTLMETEGMRLVFNPTELGAFGLVEVAKLIPLARRVRSLMLRAMERERPDVLVLIDFPGFNMRLAAEARARNIRCVYYFSPSAWAWGKGRAKKVARSVSMVAAVFPFEEAVYRAAGAAVTFVGHPLKDMVHREIRDDDLRAKLGLSCGPVVALCPGSRRKEISALFPVMLGAAKLLEARVPGLQFVCPVAPTVDMAALKTQSDSFGLPVRFHQGCIYDVYAITTTAVIASGTATLEAALAGVPMVVVYKVAPLTYAIFKRLVTIAHISLPNIVAGRAIVRELLQEAANAARIAEEVVALLESPEQQEQMRADLAEVAERLGPPGAASRAAQVVVSVGEETL